MKTRLVQIFCVLNLLNFSQSGRLRRNLDFQLLKELQSTPFLLKDGLNNFNNAIFEQVSESTNGNTVISPFSIHTALTMALLGAPTESKTYKELAAVLFNNSEEFKKEYLINYLKVISFYDVQGSDVKIKLGNKAYALKDISIKADYLDILRNFFKSSVERVDFARGEETAAKINEFVSEKTNGKIKDLVSPESFSQDTRFLLINAMYFKGDWKIKFDKDLTKPMQFNIDSQTKIEYPFGMRLEKEDLKTADLTDSKFPAKVLELPYGNKQFSMLLILPEKGQNIQNLNLNHLNTQEINQKLVKSQVNAVLPRFKIEYETSMRDNLEKLNVRDIFDIARANLSDIADAGLYVADVIHKAVIEVNEEGSEAAAATAVQIDTRLREPEKRKVNLTFDRPFLFVIHDNKHKIPLFMGRLVDPSGLNELKKCVQDGGNPGKNISFECSNVTTKPQQKTQPNNVPNRTNG